jgi:uncharacterized protein YcbK (DUF882 family)
MNTKEQAYCDYIDSLGLEHISGKELVNYSRRTRNGVQAGIPPKTKWDNLPETLFLVDAVRRHYGRPVSITSAYRCPAYNKLCGGASQSWHMQGYAIDFVIKGIRPSYVRNLLLKWRQAGQFKGGLGRYTNFTHVDTRGSNATWG